MQMARSSSTTRMRAVTSASSAGLARQRHAHLEGRCAGPAGEGDGAVVRVDRSLGDGEPQPRAGGLERHERVEDPRLRLGRDAGAVVGDPYEGVIAVPRDGDGNVLLGAAVLQGVHRVFEKVYQ